MQEHERDKDQFAVPCDPLPFTRQDESDQRCDCDQHRDRKLPSEPPGQQMRVHHPDPVPAKNSDPRANEGRRDQSREDQNQQEVAKRHRISPARRISRLAQRKCSEFGCLPPPQAKAHPTENSTSVASTWLIPSKDLLRLQRSDDAACISSEPESVKCTVSAKCSASQGIESTSSMSRTPVSLATWRMTSL